MTEAAHLAQVLLEAESGSAREFLKNLRQKAGPLAFNQFPIKLSVVLRNGETKDTQIVGTFKEEFLYISRPRFPFVLRDRVWQNEAWEYMSEVIQMSIQEGDDSRIIDNAEDEDDEETLSPARPTDVISWSYAINRFEAERAQQAGFNEL